jgi:putative membrane protein
MDQQFWKALIGTGTFGLAGIALMLVAYKLFDIVTPKIDVQDELAKNKNVAVGIVVAGLFVGVGLIVAAAVG